MRVKNSDSKQENPVFTCDKSSVGALGRETHPLFHVATHIVKLKFSMGGGEKIVRNRVMHALHKGGWD